jgi:hypothetical protein
MSSPKYKATDGSMMSRQHAQYFTEDSSSVGFKMNIESLLTQFMIHKIVFSSALTPIACFPILQMM